MAYTYMYYIYVSINTTVIGSDLCLTSYSQRLQGMHNYNNVDYLHTPLLVPVVAVVVVRLGVVLCGAVGQSG